MERLGGEAGGGGHALRARFAGAVRARAPRTAPPRQGCTCGAWPCSAPNSLTSFIGVWVRGDRDRDRDRESAVFVRTSARASHSFFFFAGPPPPRLPVLWRARVRPQPRAHTRTRTLPARAPLPPSLALRGRGEERARARRAQRPFFFCLTHSFSPGLFVAAHTPCRPSGP